MELFDKIYSCYYHVLRHILSEADGRGISRSQAEELCRTYGYVETPFSILPKLTDGSWPLLSLEHENNPFRSLGFSVLHQRPPKLPLTALQKSWLKALLSDPRFQLFFTDQELLTLTDQLKDIKPLYRQKDFHYYDRFKDGDSYDRPEYRERFQTILKSLTDETALLVSYEGKKHHVHTFEVAPYQLQYSSKDDKFRLCCLKYSRSHYSVNIILNLERIRACRISPDPLPEYLKKDLPRRSFHPVSKAKEPVLLEISGERNSLERCMLHFASYEKHTEYNEEGKCWLCSIYYDMADETELLIDILSFGPVVRVLGPESFLRQIRSRVKKQHELFYSPLE